jgi:hypothetical protein
MPRLPPVEKFFHTRLRATFWPGVGYSHVTFDQSHSSSSATSWQRPVSVPWPISERATRTTTVSSGLITTQALTSGGSAVWARAERSGMPSVSAPAVAEAVTMKPRREMSIICVMVRSSLKRQRLA